MIKHKPMVLAEITTTEIFYMTIGGAAFWVLTLILRKAKKNNKNQ